MTVSGHVPVTVVPGCFSGTGTKLAKSRVQARANRQERAAAKTPRMHPRRRHLNTARSSARGPTLFAIDRISLLPRSLVCLSSKIFGRQGLTRQTYDGSRFPISRTARQSSNRNGTVYFKILDTKIYLHLINIVV